MSDIGRWGLLTKGEFPPGKLGFYKGRWTNGRVWVEVLAEQMGINTPTLDNYAQAGATSGLENIFSPLKKLLKIDKSITLDGMLGQINRYVASKPKTNDSTLYILMAGSNDIKNYLVNGSPNIDENTIANNISSGVQLLANIGASHFLLVNQIDLVNAPGFSSEKRSNTIVELCTLTNNALKVLV